MNKSKTIYFFLNLLTIWNTRLKINVYSSFFSTVSSQKHHTARKKADFLFMMSELF